MIDTMDMEKRTKWTDVEKLTRIIRICGLQVNFLRIFWGSTWLLLWPLCLINPLTMVRLVACCHYMEQLTYESALCCKQSTATCNLLIFYSYHLKIGKLVVKLKNHSLTFIPFLLPKQRLHNNRLGLILESEEFHFYFANF